MENANEGLVVIGVLTIVWGFLSFFGGGFFQGSILAKYARRFDIVDEKGLIRHEFVFRVFLGAWAVGVGLFQHIHNNLTITIILLSVGMIIVFKIEKNLRGKFLKEKSQKE